MRTWLFFVVAVFLFGTVWFSFTKHTALPEEVEVLRDVHILLTEAGYEPHEVTIQRGGSVTFGTQLGKAHWPASNLHPTHEIYSEFDPGEPIPSNSEWSFTFDRVGTFNFHDHIRAYYTGVIHVVE